MEHDLKTYDEWRLEGRQVDQGQKALFYRVSPDRSGGAAVFSADQTGPIVNRNPEVSEWTDVIPAEEWLELKPTSKGKPRVRVNVDQDGYVNIWVGPRKEAIKWLRDAGWRYEPALHRWVKRGLEAEKIANEFTKFGYFVEREYMA